MQGMDAEGQTSMATVLRSLKVDTAIVIAHGLASDALYGAFDAVDVVEKRRDASAVRLAVTGVATPQSASPQQPPLLAALGANPELFDRASASAL